MLGEERNDVLKWGIFQLSCSQFTSNTSNHKPLISLITFNNLGED